MIRGISNITVNYIENVNLKSFLISMCFRNALSILNRQFNLKPVSLSAVTLHAGLSAFSLNYILLTLLPEANSAMKENV